MESRASQRQTPRKVHCVPRQERVLCETKCADAAIQRKLLQRPPHLPCPQARPQADGANLSGGTQLAGHRWSVTVKHDGSGVAVSESQLEGVPARPMSSGNSRLRAHFPFCQPVAERCAVLRSDCSRISQGGKEGRERERKIDSNERLTN